MNTLQRWTTYKNLRSKYDFSINSRFGIFINELHLSSTPPPSLSLFRRASEVNRNAAREIRWI